MAFKISWTPPAGVDSSKLSEVLSDKGYRFREDRSGVWYLPEDQGYGDAEDIEDDIRSVLPTGGRLSVRSEEDTAAEPVYHN